MNVVVLNTKEDILKKICNQGTIGGLLTIGTKYYGSQLCPDCSPTFL